MLADTVELRSRILHDVNERVAQVDSALNRDWLLGYSIEGIALPLIDPQGRGIRNPAAWNHSLSITTTEKGRYRDEEIGPGKWHYPLAVNRHGQLDPSNGKYFNASTDAVPVLYFYKPVPRQYLFLGMVEVIAIDRSARVSTIELLEAGHASGSDPSPLEQAWVARMVKTRLHQPRFRTVVLDAYRNRCAICGLPEPKLLDAAHIRPYGEASPGNQEVPNGLALCTIHHRAYDRKLLGIDGERRLYIHPDIEPIKDGPVLAASLQDLPGTTARFVPRGRLSPDPDRLETTFKEFLDSLPA